MPSAWTNKDERQYEKIRESVKERGAPERRAKEIASRTVNKRRRKQGRTPNKTTQGTGNPRLPLGERTKDELYNRAGQLGISGRSQMSKKQLAAAIRRAG
jgi:hypothetical protein